MRARFADHSEAVVRGEPEDLLLLEIRKFLMDGQAYGRVEAACRITTNNVLPQFE